MGTFTLARGLREIRRVQTSQEDSILETEGDDEEAIPEKTKVFDIESGGELRTDYAENETIPDIVHTESSTSPEADKSEVSEKVRGKMRARRSSSISLSGSLERVAAAGVGKNGFIPTQEWVTICQSIHLSIPDEYV